MTERVQRKRIGRRAAQPSMTHQKSMLHQLLYINDVQHLSLTFFNQKKYILFFTLFVRIVVAGSRSIAQQFNTLLLQLSRNMRTYFTNKMEKKGNCNECQIDLQLDV